MLEKLPEVVGHVLSGVRAGLDEIAFNTLGLRAGHGTLQLASLAFAGVSLLALWMPVGIAALLLLPLLAWSRLRLARHTPPEVIGGALLGVLAGVALRLAG